MADKYANIMNARVVTAGATIASAEIQTGASLADKRGMLIDQIDYVFDETVITDFIAGAGGDFIKVGWFVQTPTTSSDFQFSNSRMVHELDTICWVDGTPANSYLEYYPQTKVFTPPIIMAGPKIILGCIGSAAISGGAINARIYFRYIDLKPQEYIELAEAFVLTS